MRPAPVRLRWRTTSPSGSSTQISGTATSGNCLCLRASLNRASGRNTEGASWSLPSTIGQAMSARSVFLPMIYRDARVSSDRFDRKAGGLPFGVAVLKPADAIAARPERCDGFERKHAIGAAAVGDHLSALRKFDQASFQFGERNVESPGKMAQCELVFGSYIEHRDQIVAQPRDQVVTRDRFERVAGLKVIAHDAADLGNIAFADAPQRFDQRDHFGIAGQAIENVFAATLSIDEARPPEDLQVARGVGERQMRPGR